MNFKVDSQNRGAAKKMLTFTGLDSRKVRKMTVSALQENLIMQINAGKITREQVERTLARAGANDAPKQEYQDHQGIRNDYDYDNEEGQNNQGEGEGNAGAAEDWDGDPDFAGEDQGEAEAGAEGEAEAEAEGEGNAEEPAEQKERDAAGCDDNDSEQQNQERIEAYRQGAADSQNGKERNAQQYQSKHEQDAYNQGYDYAEQDAQKKEGDGEGEENEGEENEEQGDGEGEAENEELPFDQPEDDEPILHASFKTVLKYIKAGLNVALVGPAGTGKSYISRQVAEKLKKPFYVNGAMLSKYDLIGYCDAHGTYHETPAYQAFSNGGVHCFDELDASAPDAVVAFNGMTDDQPFYTFPCGQVEQHEDYVAIACMNTYGNGATADYVGRYKQDAASMSRFVKVYIGYDDKIEAKIAGKHTDILTRVRKLRAACESLGIRHIVSTRMIVQAVKAREIGKATRRELDRDVFFAGLDDNAIKQLKSAMERK